MITFLAALVLTATFHPTRPTVGDPITVDFPAPVVLNTSTAYEVVSQRGARVVIRAFDTKPVVVSGRVGDQTVSATIPIRSVLKANDKLQPAPLKPPKREPYPRAPFVAIGIAALAAAVAWAAVVLLARRRSVRPEVVIAPAERFLSAVAALRDSRRAAARWAQLADATRAYLAAVRPQLGAELTTRELLAALPEGAPVVIAEILRQGDLEKFSPWGAAPSEFDGVARRAAELPSWAEPPAPAAAEEAA